MVVWRGLALASRELNLGVTNHWIVQFEYSQNWMKVQLSGTSWNHIKILGCRTMVACNLSLINTAICAGPWVSLWKIFVASQVCTYRSVEVRMLQNLYPSDVEHWLSTRTDCPRVSGLNMSMISIIFAYFCHQFSRHWDSMRRVFHIFSSTRWVMKRLQDHQLAQWPLLDDIVGAQWLVWQLLDAPCRWREANGENWSTNHSTTGAGEAWRSQCHGLT